MKVLLLALGFAAVFEGLLPFFATERWRQWLALLSQADPRLVRRAALSVILTGLALIWAVTETMP